jgi:ABC-type polysaccharide/polyol phosphate transport system ATPase subunit
MRGEPETRYVPAGEALAADGEVASPDAIVACDGVWKTFRLPYDRPYTLKQRVLHPHRSRAARRLNALRDVTFGIEPGSFFGVIGRNGSGKSTLLKCLAGIYEPTQGTIEVSGRISPFIELGVGFNPELTALDNVVVNAALLGIAPAQARARFDDVIRFAELEEFVDLKLKNYSSGMYVRLGFAAAIQAQADIYLVDEVLAVGDARFQEKCFDTFRRLKREGRTVVFVTHDLSAIERFCDRALLLERGEVAAIGDPREVTQVYLEHNLAEEQAEAPHEEDGDHRRWGDRSAEIVECWLEDATGRQDVLRQGREAVFRVRVRFNEAMIDPIFGVIFKNERGDHAFATNTMFDGLQTGRFEAGDEVTYALTFEPLLADGRHMASPAVAHRDATRFADWREDLLSFVVRAERYTGGVVDLPHSSSVERVQLSSEARTA